MPSDQNTTKNPIPEENSIPASPQEPTEPALENTTDLGDSEPSVPVEGLGANGDDLKGVGYDNIPPPEDSIPSEPEKTQENQAEIPLEPTDPQPNPASNGTSEPKNEPVFEPVEAPEPVDSTSPSPETAQIPVNEPFEIEPEIQENEIEQPKEEQTETKTAEPVKAEIKPEEPKTPELKKEEPIEKPKVSYLKSQKWGELLVMARNAIQFRKRKKLDKIMSLFLENSKITNDEVEKLLHVSDATATRYLSQLEKEGKVKQNGKTGKGVSYSRI
jgi:hypothetical protein